MTTENRTVLGALCGALLCSCSGSQETLFPGTLAPITDIGCRDRSAPPPMALGAIEGWPLGAGWASRVMCEHRHAHRYVDVSIPGQLCLGLNRGVGAMVAHPPIADGPGTVTVQLAAQVKDDQRIELALSRGPGSESPDWARSVSAALECFRSCASEADERPRRCRPVVRLHDTLELDLGTGAPHERHQALPEHSPQDYELRCALKDEYGFPLPTAGTVTAEIVVERRSLGFRIDGALVSGFGPSYRLDHPRWSCEHMDGTPVEDAAARLFVLGLPFGEPAESPDQPGYELAFEHWSPAGDRCAAAPPAGNGSDGAWMCVRDARYAACDPADCPETCGDGTCDAWETCSTCQSDCTACGAQVAELAIVSIDCGPSVDAGGPVSCDIVIANQGTADTGEFDNHVWFSRDETFSSVDALIGGCRSDPIEAGATSTVTCSGMIPAATEAGTWYLGIGVDSSGPDSSGASSSGAVAELDESNNFDAAAITVVSDYVPPADLVIASVDCLSPSVVTGRAATCLVAVKNVGGRDAGPFSVDLRLSTDTVIAEPDILLTTCQVAGVGAGASQTISCTGTIPLGTMTGIGFIGVMADTENVVPESDDSNNVGHDGDFVVIDRGPADLVVSSLECPWSATSPGTIRCSVRIGNQGDSSASWISTAMRLSNDTNITSADVLLGTCDPGSLSAGESRTITCTGNVPAGYVGFWYVGIMADSSSFVPELDEGNNTGRVSITLTGG